MSQKRHQGDPKGGDSTESCDENDNKSQVCTHVARAVDLSRIKKALVKTGLVEECEQCKQAPPAQLEEAAYFEVDNTLWLCLQCGNQACGRTKGEHALQHYNTPRSDNHGVCVNTTSWMVWCYECNDMINIDCKKKLLEAVEYLQKVADGKNKKSNMELAVIPFVAPPLLPGATAPLPRPRGLQNLGNTCFFNSVVQCLSQTPYLVELLNETSQPGQHFRLPGGRIDPPSSSSSSSSSSSDNNGKSNHHYHQQQQEPPLILDPMEGTLEPWRPLARALAETLSEMQNGRSECYTPRDLLARLTGRMPQFGGGDQHDSHELLRHLLEAVREEDLKRYQAVILEKLGLSLKTDPKTVEGDRKKIIKFYGQQASDLLLPTEQVFRGVLVSTLQCQNCQHTSHRDEFFLDLSLPISEKQIPPVLRRKAEDIEDDTKPSKHQIKKEKRAERKRNKKSGKKQQQQLIHLNLHNGDDVNMETTKSDESESDADVEDNAEATDEATKGMESGYNSDKVDNNSSPDNSNNRGGSPDMRVDDSGVPSPAAHGGGVVIVGQCTPDNSPASSETNIDMGSPLLEHNSPEEEVGECYERPESRLSFVNNNKNVDLKMDLSKLSLMNDGDSNKITSATADKMEEEEDDNNFEGACGGVEKMEEDEAEEEEEEEEEEVNLWTNTISARYQCEEGEYSVQSCLNQFTACELMTGNNKVSCKLCTKRHGGADKKTVYTNATKQLLIYNPPAVLILHLKRFQVHRFRAAKVSKFVKFPLLLDLAPFCSRRSQHLPTFEVGQTKVLYSLYGVVEHSGSIHGGHYTAFVKVRPKVDQNSYRWQFLPKNQQQGAVMAPKGAAGGEPEEPPGNWYYISDSHVSPTSESRVLNAQAYLLFYERLL